ncbi:MAG: hypothetical protein V9E94_14575 [Microthrixaceae bacterium]
MTAVEPVRLLEPRVDVNSPFGRLALTHVLSLAGDALVAMSLAGSLFFDVDPAGARIDIALYLLFTMAPFAVVGPLIGPAMDRARGGHRMVLIGSCGRAGARRVPDGVAGRATTASCVFPEAFLMLVMAKTYQVAKAAIVPTVVDGDAGLGRGELQAPAPVGSRRVRRRHPRRAADPARRPGRRGAPGGRGRSVVRSVASLRVPATTIAAEPRRTTSERAELRSAGVLQRRVRDGDVAGLGRVRHVRPGLRAPRSRDGRWPRGRGPRIASPARRPTPTCRHRIWWRPSGRRPGTSPWSWR